MNQCSAIRLWNEFANNNYTAMYLLNLPEGLTESSIDTPQAVDFLRQWADKLEKRDNKDI